MAFMESSMTAFMAAEETSVKTQSNLPTSQQPISHHRPQVTLTQKSYPYKCQLDPIKKNKKQKTTTSRSFASTIFCIIWRYHLKRCQRPSFQTHEPVGTKKAIPKETVPVCHFYSVVPRVARRCCTNSLLVWGWFLLSLQNSCVRNSILQIHILVAFGGS